MDRLNDIQEYLNKVAIENVSEVNQISFIKEKTEYEIDRLKALLHDVDKQLEEVSSDDVLDLDPEEILNKMREVKKNGNELPFITIENPDFREAIVSCKPTTNIPKYLEHLDVGGMFYSKYTYNVRIFRSLIIKKLSEIQNNIIKETAFDPAPIVDLSKTKATDKLIYLNELGILDYLITQEPFKHSRNKLASVLSAITDEKPTTLQPKLNAMLSEHTNAPQNNPYNSTAKVSKIKQALIQLGYNFSK